MRVRSSLPGLDDALGSIAARAAEHDEDGSFPFEAFDALWPTGALRATIPVDAGGLGFGLSETAELLVAIGEADPAVALSVSQHLVAHADVGGWEPQVLAEVRASSVDGVALINALRVEPELGTPGRGGLPATVAERLPGGRGWRLSGRKIYSTGIPLLRWMLVWARTDDSEPLQGNFLVESGTPGYRVERTWDSLGMRATRSDDVVFEGAEVPVDHAIGLVDRPVPRPSTLAWNALVIAAIYHGVARSARDWLVRYLHERVPSNLGAPLASLPRFQQEVGRIEALLTTGDALLATVAAAFDAGDPAAPGGGRAGQAHADEPGDRGRAGRGCARRQPGAAAPPSVGASPAQRPPWSDPHSAGRRSAGHGRARCPGRGRRVAVTGDLQSVAVRSWLIR